MGPNEVTLKDLVLVVDVVSGQIEKQIHFPNDHHETITVVRLWSILFDHIHSRGPQKSLCGGAGRKIFVEAPWLVNRSDCDQPLLLRYKLLGGTPGCC